MSHHSRLSLAALALTGTLLAACGGGDDDPSEPAAQQTTVTTAPPPVTAEMIGADGSPAGQVTFVEAGGRLVVEGRFTNLPPGFHGFHIHAVGKCERGTPAFGSAGGHLTVGDQSHPAHAGDQPVVLALLDRTAEIRFTTDRYKLSDLLVPEGRAVIVHADPDNYGNVPTRYARQTDATTRSTGDAGDRIACGVVGGGGVGATSTTATAGATTTTARSGLTTTTVRGGSTTTVRAGATLDCQSVGFTPNSEDLASSVRATGLPCSEAEAFVRIAGQRTSSGGPAQVDVEGYRCVRVRSTQEPIPQAFYECTSGTKKVTFTRT